MNDQSISNNLKTLPLFILAMFLVFAFGGLFQPGEWYEQLNKAPWSPPNIAFPIVWTILYTLIGIAGWRLFQFGDKTLTSLWMSQLILNALWSWIFFGQHWVLLGLVDIVLIDFLVINLILKSYRASQKTVALLLLPYIAWLLLATTLNTYILFAN